MSETIRVEMSDPPQETPPQDTPPQEGAPADRPPWLPEKFENPEALAAAYGELERQQSQRAPKIESPAEGAPEPPAGFDSAALSEELQANNGEFTAETYALFEQAGIPRAMVDTYVQGVQALADRVSARVNEVAGGAEAFAAMSQWAATGLSKERIEAFNGAVASGNMAAIEMAVESLRAAYTEANGKAPTLLSGPAVRNTSGVAPFASNDEVVQAMRDPRYRTDEAYRKQVEARLAAGL